MALPEDWDLVPVRGRYIGTDGTPLEGRVIFTPKVGRLVSPATLTTLIGRGKAITLENGAFETFLPASNDPDVVPNGFTYSVKEDFPGGSTYDISIPLSAVGIGVELATVAPTAPNSGSSLSPVTRLEFDALRDLVNEGIAPGQIPLPDGATLTVRRDGLDWPARPTSDPGIVVQWVGGTESTPPLGALEGVDLWIRSASTDPDTGGGEDPPPTGYRMGWELTPQNTGLASKGVTESMLTPGTVPPYYLQPSSPTVTTNQHRKVFNLNNSVLAPGGGAVFTECLFIGSTDLIIVNGDCTFIDCDFVITEDSLMTENVAVFANGYYDNYANSHLVMTNCRMTGGHFFVDATNMRATLTNVYGYDQGPEVGALQHRDGFTSRGAGAGRIKLLGCRFDSDQDSTTGAFFLQDTYNDGVVGLEARDCMFEGAGYVMTLETSDDLIIVNNRIRPHGPYSYGPVVSTNTTFAQWTDNHLYASGQPDAKGTLIPQPN